MSDFRKEAMAFRQAKLDRIVEARQNVAVSLIAGVDLAAALRTSGEERATILRRLARLIERERLKGVRRHWSYDLNRHIALKQAYDRLSGKAEEAREVGTKRPARRGRRQEKKAARGAAFSNR